MIDAAAYVRIKAVHVASVIAFASGVLALDVVCRRCEIRDHNGLRSEDSGQPSVGSRSQRCSQRSRPE